AGPRQAPAGRARRAGDVRGDRQGGPPVAVLLCRPPGVGEGEGGPGQAHAEVEVGVLERDEGRDVERLAPAGGELIGPTPGVVQVRGVPGRPGELEEEEADARAA